MNDELKSLMELQIAQSIEIVNKGEEVMPRWIGVNDANEHFIIMTPWSNDNEKLLAVDLVRRYFALHGVVRYTLSTEVWVVMRDLDADVSRLRPADDPDREERVQCLGVDATIKTTCWANITRENGKPRCGEVEWAPKDSFSGRMTELLPASAQRPTPAQTIQLEILWAKLGGKRFN